MAYILAKLVGQAQCKQQLLPSDGEVRDLPQSKMAAAQAAKEAAISILQDALDKKDRLLVKDNVPKLLSGYKYVMCRFAVVREKDVKEVLKVMRKIKFKEDTKKQGTYAYVIPGDLSYTVYLCKAFWDASDMLCKDSKLGTLIHEVSHFLGADDITYDEKLFPVNCAGQVIKPEYIVGSCDGSSDQCAGALRRMNPDKVVPSRALATDKWALDLTSLNANSLEYEFELTLNHKKKYRGGRYPCCGETNPHSLCIKSIPDLYIVKTGEKINQPHSAPIKSGAAVGGGAIQWEVVAKESKPFPGGHLYGEDLMDVILMQTPQIESELLQSMTSLRLY